MKKDSTWFSILIGMTLTLLIVLSAMIILAYILPFMRAVKGIENAAGAYYQAYSGVEKSLMFLKTRELLTTETWATQGAGSPSGTTYRTYSSGSTIPQKGFWNSPYHPDYNIISPTDPIQLEIGNLGTLDQATWNDIFFHIKVPDTSGQWNIWMASGSQVLITWTLSSKSGSVLSASWESYLTGGKIDQTFVPPPADARLFHMVNSTWSHFNGNEEKTIDFYNSNCGNTWCILRASVVNELWTSSWTQIPYLEYQLHFPGSIKIPDRYTRIESYGNSYGYQKKLEVKVPQQTIGQAFDFTVFQ